MSQGPNKLDWKARLERARQAQKNAQADSGNDSGATQQPEKAQAQHTENNMAGSRDQSIADLRLDSFRKNNQRLAKGKSQLPNVAVQSRIFPPTRKGRRPVFNWVEVPVSRDDIEIYQRGEQLNQLDLTGWIVLIKFAEEDLVARFSRYEFLKAMRRHDSSRDYRWLRAFLDRIGFTQFAIYFHHNNEKWERYSGALAPQDYEDSQGRHVVQLSKPLSALFGFDGWSYINLDQRLALGQNQWAQAFHAYLSTHTCPENGLWCRKQDLKQEWGPEYQDASMFLRDFRRRVLKPLHDIDFIKKVEEKKTAIGLWW
jgi:hypothetical protein